MQQGLADFLDRAAIVQRAAHVAFQLLRALEGGQRGQGDQAAGLARQAFAVPDATPGMFVDEVLQRLGELGGIAQGAVDEGVAHDFPAYL
ncbi:hypothetical protein D3C84_551490 [compost metagenome]